MSAKNDKVSMPFSSAGIPSFTQDIKLAGIEIDPKMLLIAGFLFVVIVKIASLMTHVVLPQ